MNFDEFRSAWLHALRRAGFNTLLSTEETLDVNRMCRTFLTHVEPVGGQDASPFHVAARLLWVWDALQSARTDTTEEDMLTSLLGRKRSEDLDTEPAWLRVDVSLHAQTPYNGPIFMPPADRWRQWSQEVTTRLSRIEPLVPSPPCQPDENGDLEILAWMGSPTAKLVVDEEGDRWLEGLEMNGMQILTPPRHWDAHDRIDDDPDEQLDAMFTRIRAALQAWVEALDHFRT